MNTYIWRQGGQGGIVVFAESEMEARDLAFSLWGYLVPPNEEPDVYETIGTVKELGFKTPAEIDLGKLQRKVVYDAIKTLLGYPVPVPGNRRMLNQQTQEWLDDDSCDYVFSFHRCCDDNGIDPYWLRGQISQEVQRKAREVSTRTRLYWPHGMKGAAA